MRIRVCKHIDCGWWSIHSIASSCGQECQHQEWEYIEIEVPEPYNRLKGDL